LIYYRHRPSVLILHLPPIIIYCTVQRFECPAATIRDFVRRGWKMDSTRCRRLLCRGGPKIRLQLPLPPSPMTNHRSRYIILNLNAYFCDAFHLIGTLKKKIRVLRTLASREPSNVLLGHNLVWLFRYYFNVNLFIYSVSCRQVASDEAKHFKLRKVGPSDGRKVTEIKIVPKVRIQFIITYLHTYTYNNTPLYL